jgi:phage repressor protein C with HTH and peptisase S24 domain
MCSVLGADNLSITELLSTLVDKGLSCKFQAKGHSMSPFIKDGDAITVSPKIGCSPRFGDVVAFIHPRTEKLFIHRVVWKRRDAYIVKGENTLESDGLIKKENILGVVTKVERKGKKVFLGLGPERFLIALLTRKNLLLPVLLPVWRIFRPAVRIFLP